MVPEVTYADFTAIYGDGVGEDAFKACLPHAVAMVRDLTHPNVPEPWQEEAWRRAVCAAVVADSEGGMSHGLSSGGFSIGSFSVSGGSSGESDGAGAIRSAAMRELVGSGLLYMGLGSV